MAKLEAEKTFAQKAAIAIGIALTSLLLILLLYYTFDVVMLIFAAALLAIFLSGLAEILKPYIKLGDGLRVLLVSVILVAVIGGTIALLSPSIAEQVRHLRDELPRSAVKVSDYLSQYSWGKTLIDQFPGVDTIMSAVTTTSVIAGVGGVFTCIHIDDGGSWEYCDRDSFSYISCQ
jgi:predicted PurR-regulated permease PerM